MLKVSVRAKQVRSLHMFLLKQMFYLT